MNKLIPVGRNFFAIALIGLGIHHFVFRDFVTGRAPAWSESIPGRVVWAYLTGIVFVGSGIAILADKMARSTAIFAGALIFLWALLRHIPVLATSSFLSGNWTGAGKALWLVGGCLAIAATFPKVKNDCNSSFMTLMNLNREFIVVGCVSLGWFMIQSGIQHFMFTEFVASLIPGWFPGNAVFWTYFAAVALIAGGIGLFIPRTARLAALLSGLMVFSWFWIVHIPRTFLTVSDGIAVFEALAFSGIAFVIAGFLYKQEAPSDHRNN